MKGMIISLKGLVIFEKTVSKFGNGAHVLIPREYANKKLKAITGKNLKITDNAISLNFFGNQILERTARKFGTGHHITIPKEYAGQKIKIIGEKSR